MFHVSVLAGTQTDTWQAYATPGNLRITFVNDNNYWTGISNAHQFRYIIIPGAKKSTVAGIKPGIFYSNGRKLDGNAVNGVVQNYKQMSYEQVCQRLGIDE